MAETREFAGGGLRKGDRPDGEEIAEHLKSVIDHLPKSVKKIRARADSGFYCWDAVRTYEGKGCEFVLVARKTPRLVDELQAAPPALRQKRPQGCRTVIQPIVPQDLPLLPEPSGEGPRSF